MICLHFEKDSFDLANGFVTCFLTKGPQLPQAVTSTVIYHFITIILNWKVSIFRIFYANDRFVKFLSNNEKKNPNSLSNFFFLLKRCFSTLTHGAGLFDNFPSNWPNHNKSKPNEITFTSYRINQITKGCKTRKIWSHSFKIELRTKTIETNEMWSDKKIHERNQTTSIPYWID